MKLLALQQNNNNNNNSRRSHSLRTTITPLDSTVDGVFKSPASLSWLVFHGLCCLISLVLGFRFSRLIFFLLFNNASTSSFYSAAPLLRTAADVAETLTLRTSSSSSQLLNLDTALNRTSSTTSTTSSRVVVGRHGILIRPWPHPNPTEVMKAHRIIERVQKEQRIQYGIKNSKTLIVVTPTYVRTFQTLHLTGLMHSLMLVPYDLVWIVVEAGRTSNETADLLAKSGLRTIHVSFNESMPISWDSRHRMEARMRVHALRVVRDRRLDGIVIFADDSNMHNMELFDEIQKVKWIGAVSVGILAHSWNSDDTSSFSQKQEEDLENLPVPVQGPACNSSGQLSGWHIFNSLPYMEKGATYIDDRATVLPRKLEWAGFILNSKLVWKEAEDKPEWVRDLDMVAEDGGYLESPLSLVKDTSFVEPLGDCGRKVLLWWLRVEARADSKFPLGWKINPPLEMTVPAKHTPWPDAPPELPSNEKINEIQDRTEKRLTRIGRVSRSRHSSRNKRKHEQKTVDTQV